MKISQSIFETEFLKIINNQEIKIISFDIFDTLFFRKCLLPENIFEIVGENDYVKKHFDTASSFKKYRMYAEKNARITHKNKQDITLEEIYEELSIPKKVRKKIKQIELKTEKNYLVVNYDLERWIDLVIKSNKKVILISDMYLSKEELNYVCLEKLKNIKKISDIYVSSEYGLTKSKGDLYLKVLEKENIEANELFHIGDNEISDILIPKNLNINSLYYGYSNFQKMALDYERAYINKDLEEGNSVRKLAMLRNPYDDELESFYFSIGASIFGIVLFEFSHWLNELSKKHKIEQYNFIMREGFILEKFFKKLFPDKKTNLIFASRKSTFPIILDLNNMSSVLLGTQRAFSIKDLYENLQLDITNDVICVYQNELLSKASQIDLGKNSLYEEISNDLIINKNEILEKNNKQNEFIKEYFEDFCINKKSLFIDFGAGGTILNRIRQILPKKKLPSINALFFTSERGYSIQSKNRTLSFLPYDKECSVFIEALAKSPEIFEILLNLDFGTTRNYSKVEDKIIPNLFFPRNNRKIIKKIRDSFITGIESFFEVAKLYEIRENTFTREYISKLLSRMINLPTKFEAEIFGDLEHDEGNGSEHIYKIVDENKIEFIKNVGLEKIYFEYQKNKPKYKHIFPCFEAVVTNIKSDFLIGNYKEPNNNSYNLIVISQILEQIDKSGKKDFMIYGAGELFKELLPFLKDRDIKIISLIDSRAKLQEFEVLNHKVISLEKAFRDLDVASIIIASGIFVETIKNEVNCFAMKNNKKIDIFCI